mgnify:FL=1
MSSKRPVESPFLTKTDQSTQWSEECQELLSPQVFSNLFLENNLKSEKDTFKTHYARGDKEIEKMYDTLREKQKQNVFVMTDMKKEEITPFINTDLYNLMGTEVLKKHEGKDITLNEVLTDLCDPKYTPILIECGPKTMNEYWSKCKKTKDMAKIDLLYFACFEGSMKKECIGDEYQFDESCFKKVWESEKIDVKDDMENTGKLVFKVYEWKKDWL